MCNQESTASMCIPPTHHPPPTHNIHTHAHTACMHVVKVIYLEVLLNLLTQQTVEHNLVNSEFCLL